MSENVFELRPELDPKTSIRDAVTDGCSNRGLPKWFVEEMAVEMQRIHDEHFAHVSVSVESTIDRDTPEERARVRALVESGVKAAYMEMRLRALTALVGLYVTLRRPPDDPGQRQAA